MSENKRQHFVPQLYLKLFSKDDKTLTVYTIRKNRIVSKNASLARQCYRNYFYGNNTEIEKMLSDIELEVKPVIEEILETKKKGDIIIF
ncbi:MAG: DUF4238 domain-containing protein [Candidatus Cloacimonetes bacterium]|nr:DUF4238 domain-containing protein [Candidatus Cloacimonadota bacterium]